MANGDTKTNQYLDIAANGSRADLPTDTCCETRSQTLIREVAERIIDLEEEVQELEDNPDVADIVDTYADLMAYDTSTLTDRDIIRVLNDETHGGESTYYRYSKATDSWTYIGSTGQRAKQSDWDEDDSTDMAFIKNKPFYSESVDSDFEQEPTTTSGSTPDTNYVWFIEQFQDYALHEVLADFNDGDTVYATITYSVNGAERSDIGKFTLTFEGNQANLDYDAPAGSRWYGAYISEVNLGDTTVRWPVLATDSAATVYITNIEYGRVKQIDAEYIPIDNDTITVDANGKLKSSGGGSGPTVVQTTGTSTTDVMSQNATTAMVYADPSTKEKVQIGSGAASGGSESIAIGYNSGASGLRSVAIGTRSTTGAYNGTLALGAHSGSSITANGMVDFGTSNTSYGYSSSNYRLLTGLYGPQSAHDAATKGYVDGKILSGAGAPTTSTTGTVGQVYQDTTNGKLYICTAIVPGTDPDPDTYTWTEVGAGGGGGGGVTVLTSADYNYHSSGSVDNRIALWLLDSGFYKLGENNIPLSFSTTEGGIYNSGTSFFILNKTNTATICLGGDGVQNPSVYQTEVTSGVSYGLTSQIATLNQLNGRVKQNAGAPTTSTVGTVGQLLEDTTNGKLYICTDATNPYVWEEVGAGGGSSYTAGDGIDITNAVISATNTGKAKGLTTDDYNWNSSAQSSTTTPFDSVALWLLPAGEYYKTDSSVIVRPHISLQTGNIGDMFIVAGKESATYRGILKVPYDGNKPIKYSTDTSTGYKYIEYELARYTDITSRITQNAGAPTTSTTGTVGQLYEDTTNGKLYICTAVSGSTYTWEEVGAGGGGGGGVTVLTSADYNWPVNNPNGIAYWLLESGYYTMDTDLRFYHDTAASYSTGRRSFLVGAGDNDKTALVMVSNSTAVIEYRNEVATGAVVSGWPVTLLNSADILQTTGASTTKVMSQNAVTSMVYADPETQYKIKIGAGTSSSEGNDAVEIGHSAAATATSSIALGNSAEARANRGIAIGNRANLLATSPYAILLGHSTSASNASYSVGLGTYSKITMQGQVDISTSNSNTPQGYNNSNYRLLTGVYDGQSAHDAATLAQGNTLATSAPATTTVGVLGQLYTDTTNMHTYQCTAIDTTDPDNPSYTWTQRW